MSLVLAGMPAPSAAAPVDELEAGRLLQAFALAAHGVGFRHLGDARDFDHGHFLFAAGDLARPVAVLYHTQELAAYHSPDGPFGYVDPASRNWLQWLATGRIENAAAYERKSYPDTEAWRLFQERDLPGYRAHHTIVPPMLDPEALGFEIAATQQWTFRSADCPSEPSAARPRVRVPTGQEVCVELAVPLGARLTSADAAAIGSPPAQARAPQALPR